MRLLDILPDVFLIPPYLMEVNLINAGEIKQRVAKISERVRSPKHRVWFKSQLFKYIIDIGDGKFFAGTEEGRRRSLIRNGFSPVKRLSKDSPRWARDEMGKGGELYRYRFDRTQHMVISEIIRWLNNGVNPDKSINMTFSDAYREAEHWKKWLSKKKDRENWEDLVQQGTKLVTKYSNGFYWVSLNNAECISDEGIRQRNCLRGTEMTYDGETYYSLRNKKGKSLVTLLSTDDGLVKPTDIKMAENERIHDDFYEYVIDLLDKEPLVVAYVEEDDEDEDEEEFGDEWDQFDNIVIHAKRLGYSVLDGNGGIYFSK